MDGKKVMKNVRASHVACLAASAGSQALNWKKKGPSKVPLFERIGAGCFFFQGAKGG